MPKGKLEEIFSLRLILEATHLKCLKKQAVVIREVQLEGKIKRKCGSNGHYC